MATQSIDSIESYHAHIYFDGADQRRIAQEVRDEIAQRFPIFIGTLWDRPIGPHPKPMFEIGFSPADFAIVVPWLMLNRGGLSVLVHPNTGSPRRDHLFNALWLGEVLDLIKDPYLTDPEPSQKNSP
jgi:aromatic ring-cleaving dioxygenase